MRHVVAEPRDALDTPRGEVAWGSFPRFPAPAQLDEDDEAFTLTVEAPGYGKKDLAVSVSPDRIVIAGEHVDEAGTRRGRSWSRHEGRLHIEVPLGARVVQAEASAGLEHGILTVRVPKTEESRRRARRVPITS